MSPRTKSALLLILTLVMGMVLGALVSGRLVERRLDRISALRSERGFMRHLVRAVEPQDEAQREAVRAILSNAADRLGEVQAARHREIRAILDSARTELEAVLTPEQMEALDARLRLGPPGRGRGPGRRPFRPPRERP